MITGAVQAIADMFANFFGWRSSAASNQITKTVVDDKEDLEKACLYAEEMVTWVQKNATWKKDIYVKHFNSLVRKFRKYR